jgi:MerR family transcriptional regulator, copper efflux regulator
VQHLTIHDAAEATGWSPRMLRYIERLGLVDPPRSDSGYRLYREAEVERLRSLRALTTRYDVSLGDIGFAARLGSQPELRAAVDGWLAGTREPAGLS